MLVANSTMFLQTSNNEARSGWGHFPINNINIRQDLQPRTNKSIKMNPSTKHQSHGQNNTLNQYMPEC